MGACTSKESSKPSRGLDQWKVAEDATPKRLEASAVSVAAVADAKDVDVSGEQESDLVLNCIAYSRRLGNDCLTGWEDGSIQRVNWRNPVTPTAGCSSDVIKMWRPHTRAVNRLVLGESSRNIYSCSRDTLVAITTSAKATGASTVLRGHQLNVATIAVDSAEHTLCSGGRDTQTIFWDIATAHITAKNTTPQNVVTCSTWLPGEALVAQGSEDLSVKLWDPRTPLRVPAQTLRGFVYFPLNIAACGSEDDSTYLLTSSKGFNGVGCEARVWDRRTGKQLAEFSGHQQDATACCFLPLNAGIDTVETEPNVLPMLPVTASKDGTVKVWDAKTMSPLTEAHADGAKRMFTGLCSADSSTLLACTFGGHVLAYSLDRQQRTLALLPHPSRS